MNRDKFYTEYFDRSGEQSGGVLQPRDRLVIDYLVAHWPEIGNLLDIGCLNSSLGAAIRKSVKVARYYGIDLIEPEKVGSAADGMIYARGDVDVAMPFTDVRFDVIVCSEVLEHVFSPDNVFEYARNNLAQGGVLVVTTPNLAAWYNRVAFLFGYQPCFSEVSVRHNVGKVWTNDRGAVGGHMRMFTLRALVELAACYGLEVTARASTGGGSGVVGFLTTVLSRCPSLGHNLFCVFKRAGG